MSEVVSISFKDKKIPCCGLTYYTETKTKTKGLRTNEVRATFIVPSGIFKPLVEI